MTRSRPIIPRNNPVAVVSRTASWRWAWAAAQVTPVLFSSYVWLIIGTLQPLLMVASPLDDTTLPTSRPPAAASPS